MRPSLAFVLALGLAASARAAIGYSRFAQPRGEYAFEYPSDWKKTFGIETVIVHPPGKAGQRVKVSVEGYPIDKSSPATAAAFAQGLLEKARGLKKVESDRTVTVSGRAARRLALVETVKLQGRYRQTLEGPLREVYVIVPMGSHYLVVKLAGVGKPFDAALPEFERVLSSLRLNAR